MRAQVSSSHTYLCLAELFDLPLVHHARRVTCMEGEGLQTTLTSTRMEVVGWPMERWYCWSRQVSRKVRENLTSTHNSP